MDCSVGSINMEVQHDKQIFVLANDYCQSEQLGQFRLIGDRASDVSGSRICLTQNAYAEI